MLLTDRKQPCVMQGFIDDSAVADWCRARTQRGQAGGIRVGATLLRRLLLLRPLLLRLLRCHDVLTMHSCCIVLHTCDLSQSN